MCNVIISESWYLGVALLDAYISDKSEAWSGLSLKALHTDTFLQKKTSMH